MSCLEFLGCLLQFMEYLSREKYMGGCLRQRWGVCMHTRSLSFCLWHAPIHAHMLRRTCRRVNRFKMFILCCSPETSLLVSHTGEHPLGRPCSDTWCNACLLMPAVSAGEPELSRGTALALSSQRSWETGLACPGMLPPRRALEQAWGVPVLALPKRWSQGRPQPHPSIRVFPEPSCQSGSCLCMHYGIDLWSI